MKRCPQCQFIYPDSDKNCDFDQAELVTTTEAEVAFLTNTPERPALADLATTHSKLFANRKARRALTLAAAVGLVFGITITLVYLAVHRQMYPETDAQPSGSSQLVAQVSLPSPTPVVVQSPESQSTAGPPTKASSPTSKTTTTQSTLSRGPVSTNSQSQNRQTGAKQVIFLASGGKVEADEVWRTKEGVWYRRDGVVTLLKKNRVRAIVNQR